MFCTNCGAENKDEAKFCVKCGVTLGEIQEVRKPSAATVSLDEYSKKGAGFFKALFDFSFTEFITSKIIKLLYVLTIFFAGFTALIVIIIGFSIHTGTGIFSLLIGAPLIFFISVIYGRVLLEIIIVVFRIAEHLAEMAQQGRIAKKQVDE